MGKAIGYGIGNKEEKSIFPITHKNHLNNTTPLRVLYNLFIMEVKIPNQLSRIIRKFTDNNYEIYIVGGAVRDVLMRKIVYDWDLTTNATPENMLKIFPEAYYDNQFGTVGIASENEGDRPYEITTFRTESDYNDSRHPGKIFWGKNLEEDLSRREVTISAMAFRLAETEKQKDLNTQKQNNPSASSGQVLKTEKSYTENSQLDYSAKDHYINIEVELIDPYDGKKDLDSQIFRAVGNPDERYREDALRMIRAIRISSQLGFSIEEKTFKGIKNNSKLIHKIAKERIRDELLKIFASKYPYEGMLLFRNCGLMQEILPEMEKTFGIEQKSPGRHHKYDVGTHLLLSLKNCPSSNPVVRFATLIHDIGKPQTFRQLPNGTITFYNHELVSTRIAEIIADRLRFSNKQKQKFITLVRFHQFTVDEKQTDSAIRRFIRNVGLENITDMLDLRVGDRLGGGATETSWRLEEFKKRLTEVQKQPFTVSDLKIDGHDVMSVLGITPGPKVGEILGKLFDEVVENQLSNERDTLLEKLKQLN